MTGPSPPPTSEIHLREQAADWHVRLGSDLAGDADWLAFEAWLAESPAHGRAYGAVEALWSALDELPSSATTNLRTLRTRPRLEVWLGLAAAGLVAALALAFTLMGPSHLDSYVTARGEQRQIALADGSRLVLNGGSRLTVRLSRHERRVVMADAEALFDVAKDPARPFVIEVGDRQIRVVGTQFNVLHHAGDIRVTVRRGVVEVRPAGPASGAPLARLRVGQALVHREGQSGDRVGPADAEAAAAWTEGRLIFRGERLEDVASVLNRYVETPIVIAPDAQDLPVTAVLMLDREDIMVGRLATFLSLDTRREPNAIHLSRGGSAH